MGNFRINSERTKISRFAKITRINNLVSLLSSEKKADYMPYNILSIFDVKIWMLVILLLIVVSILGIGKFDKNTFLIKFLNSTIDHLECLIRNCSKFANLNT